MESSAVSGGGINRGNEVAGSEGEKKLIFEVSIEEKNLFCSLFLQESKVIDPEYYSYTFVFTASIRTIPTSSVDLNSVNCISDQKFPFLQLFGNHKVFS